MPSLAHILELLGYGALVLEMNLEREPTEAMPSEAINGPQWQYEQNKRLKRKRDA